MSKQCPQCNSKAVYAVRHDSDWGSTNVMYRVNPDTDYPKESAAQEEYGDINFFFCADCYSEWF